MATAQQHATSPPPRHLLLGEILIQLGRLTRSQLNDALTYQNRCTAPLGRILMGEGHIRGIDLRDALAHQYNQPTADLHKTPADAALCRHEHRQHYHRLGLIPWRRKGKYTLIAITRMDAEIKNWLARHYGTHVQLVWTTPRDVQHMLETLYAQEDGSDASYRLSMLNPISSARTLTTRHQRITLLGILVLLGVLIGLFPGPVFTILTLTIMALFSLTLLLKGILFALGAVAPAYQHTTLPLLTDNKLPIYTILIPLYKEQKPIPGLLRNIRQMNYPQSKLDIKLIVEADDTLTRESIKHVRPESHVEIITVPVIAPRTKPKACNYAMRFARGELVTIMDAEDRMEPQQLRKSASFFMRNKNGHTACLQARLNYHNREQNLLTRLFAIEYAAWFGFMLKGLQRMDAPIPLGGTSNHLPLQNLQRMEGWDAFNVTEDADLGMRIAMAGGKTGLLDSVTLEEAPAGLGNWMRQRSRWIKGYMQTYIVHMRRPTALWQRLGMRGFMGFQLFIGGPALVFLFTPLMWLCALGWMSGILPMPHSQMGTFLYGFTLFNWGLGIAVHLIQSLGVLKRHHWLSPGMLLAALLYPFYWLLHAWASFRAIWQLITNPHYWEKTDHTHAAIKGMLYDNV